MVNILENYTNEQRREFMKDALLENKRIEKIGDKLFALSDNEIVENGEIVTDNERPEKLRQAEFERQFFNTSLGYVRRNVTMKDGTVKNFLTDILPLLVQGVEVLTYDKANPQADASGVSLSAVADNEFNQTKVTVTNEFLNECKNQLMKDFYGEQ